jgi:uncharacterized protein (TIGR03118 family)
MSSHPSLRLGALLLLAAAGAAPLGAFAGGNQFLQRNLVANTDAYAPQIVDPTLINAWGIAIRPAGLGGHFWVTANTTGVSTQWVGDVGTFPLYQDDLRFVSVPGPTLGPGVTPSQPIIQPGTPTGVVFNGGSDFVVTQGSITAPAKFIFSTDNGVISGWTERRNPDGSFDRPHDAVTTIDRSADGTQFFGVGLDATGGRLYAANFGENPGMQIYDGTWSDITASYAGTDLGMNPFVTDGYQPFNVQALDDRLFVAYAKYGTPGEEETGDGLGRVAEFTFDGALVRTWGDGTGLNAPWGVAIAPEGFGDFGGHLGPAVRQRREPRRSTPAVLRRRPRRRDGRPVRQPRSASGARAVDMGCAGDRPWSARPGCRACFAARAGTRRHRKSLKQPFGFGGDETCALRVASSRGVVGPRASSPLRAGAHGRCRQRDPQPIGSPRFCPMRHITPLGSISTKSRMRHGRFCGGMARTP